VAQVQRTIPRRIYPFAPDGIYGIAYAHVHAIARAERFIYMESQYLWSPEITEALCKALRRGRATGLRVVIVLPAHPNVGKADSDRHVQELLRADEGHGLFQAYTLYTSARDDTAQCVQYRPIYVHAKTTLIDDAWATAGSANLNGRGMATDSEINLSTTDSDVIRRLRLRLWSEHLGCAEDELADADPVMVLGERWPAVAQNQLSMVTNRTGLLTAGVYPYPLGHVAADFGPGEVESALLDR
jgi:phosphatidylserine/phosphatidylglycerophosphate/cardiolipin synthase-like enzyme